MINSKVFFKELSFWNKSFEMRISFNSFSFQTFYFQFLDNEAFKELRRWPEKDPEG